MKTLQQLCKPRESIFDPARRDTVLDISDLIDDRIKASDFIDENFRTEGMKRLFTETFRRFERKSSQGVFVLTQAMGGGKTHNMIALGLLAKHPELRNKLGGKEFEHSSLGQVRVAGFTGRESDAPLGIWGAIAEQLGKKELFKDYYSPLSAPGQSAWVNLLKGEPLLILLDELPPYFENARAKTIGDSNLAKVTTTALANLLVAVGKAELDNICVIISDLKATYQEGSEHISKALSNLEEEVNRSALRLEPVGMNTDEVYHILRKRLFESLTGEEDINLVAQGYAQAVRDAKQMDITKASPEQFVSLLQSSYPFHFAIRDLFARFRENPGFQQTRGLIRLMRVVVAQMYDSGAAEKKYLIHPYDIDLNHRETLAEILAVNPTLENAIAHDIASEGGAVAEIMDVNLGGGSDTQDMARLLLVSSLANIPDAIRGLSEIEIISWLCAPGRDISQIKKNVFERYTTSAWYLHSSKNGKLFFKNVKNIVADLKTRADSYTRESSVRELRQFISEKFQPSMKDCYQDVLVLPAIDEITIKPDKVTMVVCEPHEQGGINPELQKFYNDLDYKNRILFLTGQYQSLESLLERSAELKAINSILKDMDDEGIPETDPQRQRALGLEGRITLQLLSAARENFTMLFYPHMEQLRSADFLMNFRDNNYNGEKQIREALGTKQKFTEDIDSDSFRRKCEARLFTQKVMLWSEVKKRAAINTQWQWHRTDALDRLKDKLVYADQWREEGGYVEKPPFPQPATDVQVQELSRNDDTGEVRLRLNPVHGEILYYEIGGTATPSSARVEDFKNFSVKDLQVSFLCVDNSGQHGTGTPVQWKNKITIKSKTYQSGGDKLAEFRAAPEAPIRYTVDGSNPKDFGIPYTEPFIVPPGTVIILAIAENGGILSDIHKLNIRWDMQEGVEVDVNKPATWKRSHQFATTQESYEFLSKLKKYEAKTVGPRVTVGAKDWVEFTTHSDFQMPAGNLEQSIEYLRGLLPQGQVSIDITALWLPNGQKLLDLVVDLKTELKDGEVVQ